MNDQIKVKGILIARKDKRTFKEHKHSVNTLRLVGAISLLMGIIIFCTPIRQTLAKGWEKVFIYIDEYCVVHDEKRTQPKIDHMQVTIQPIDQLQEYDYISMQQQEVYRGKLSLINNYHEYHFLGQEELVNVVRKDMAYKVEDKEILLNKEALNQFNWMMKDFRRSTGKRDIILTSGYRSIIDQEKILNEKKALLGKEEALNWAMHPGYSEHHSGYAVDISIYTDQGNYIKYRGQNEYGWINENCYKYGFIRRYAKEKMYMTGVKNEEWHYRYVGIPHSYLMVKMNLCLEEYINYLKQFAFDNQHLKISLKQKNYEVYFVPANEGQAETKVPVPRDKAYSISGNNEDGYIVTIG